MSPFLKKIETCCLQNSDMKAMETRRLHNSDMKKLVRIFRGVPIGVGESKGEKYRKYIKEDIHNLPRRLRSSYLSNLSKNLCSTHKGLNADLINDIWSWLRHELDGAIGKFLYPLIMSGVLTKDQEMKVRQLEPVMQTWYADFTLDTSAPPGLEPIQCGSQWKYQKDQCPACMLARIGSDEDVLFALFAGMVGRLRNKATGMDILRGIVGFDGIKSKRLRFIRYWIKASRGGDTTLFEAGDLGLEMKRLRNEWKAEQRRLRRAKYLNSINHSFEGTSDRNTPMDDTFRQSHETERPLTAVDTGCQQRTSPHSVNVVSYTGFDITERYQPKEWSSLSSNDAKLGPDPRPSNVKWLTPAAALGFDISGSREDRTLTTPYDQPTFGLTTNPRDSIDSHYTVYPESSISVAVHRPVPLRPTRIRYTDDTFPTTRQAPVQEHEAMPSTIKRQDSVLGDLPSIPKRLHPELHSGQRYMPSIASTHTILSYNGGGASAQNHSYESRRDPLDDPLYDRILTPEERVDKYRALLATHPDAYADPFGGSDEGSYASMLPVPQRKSMYSAFGNKAFDEGKFEGVDEDGEAEECEEDDREATPLRMPKPDAGRRRSAASTAWDDLY